MRELIISLSFIAAGCTTTNVSLIATHEWEGRYTGKDTVVVNGKSVASEKNDVIWVLSGSTLNRLMENITNGKND